MQFRGLVLAAAIGLAGCAGCDPGGFPSDAGGPDPVQMGTVSLAWSVIGLDGRTLACNEIGASTVFLQLTNRGQIVGAPESFSCANSPSVSQPIDPGTYDVTVELRAGRATLVTATAQLGVVVAAGRDTPLSSVTFVVDARGGLVLSLAAPPTTSNCGPAGTMGAGITGTSIALLRQDGSCAPVTFTRSGGAPYTVSCSSPVVAPCIETGETLTVANIASGTYTIHVRGKIGAADCWANDNTLQVPAQGMALIETLNLARQDDTPGC